MAEVLSSDGTWTFDGEIVRIVPGRGRKVHKLRQALGEIAVPVEAVAGIAYEPGDKGSRLRLRLRDGADPLLKATSGRLQDAADPYQLAIEDDRKGVAEYFADEVRNVLLIEQIPDGPCNRYLLPSPGVPLSASGADGTASFDGEFVRLEWNWMTGEEKKSAGSRKIALQEIESVDWMSSVGWDYGHLCFRVKNAVTGVSPQHDPNALRLWGTKKESGATVLLAAAVVARLPHPSDGTATPALEPAPEADSDHDDLLRRLRELGELHRDGVLTDEEFAAAKQAVLNRL